MHPPPDAKRTRSDAAERHRHPTRRSNHASRNITVAIGVIIGATWTIPRRAPFGARGGLEVARTRGGRARDTIVRLEIAHELHPCLVEHGVEPRGVVVEPRRLVPVTSHLCNSRARTPDGDQVIVGNLAHGVAPPAVALEDLAVVPRGEGERQQQRLRGGGVGRYRCDDAETSVGEQAPRSRRDRAEIESRSRLLAGRVAVHHLHVLNHALVPVHPTFERDRPR